MAIQHIATGEVYSDEEIARMRSALAEWAKLDLSDMSDKSVVTNYLMHEQRDWQ